MAHLPQDVKPNVADKITLRVQVYGETDSLILRVKTTTAFQKIFDVVAPRIGMHPNSFMFRHHGRRVLPNETTPADLNLGDDEVLQVEPRHNSHVEPQRETKITLRIQFPHGSELSTLRVNRTTALQNIYNAVAQELLVEPDSFFLYYDGERLVPNENTPSDLNLDDNDVLDFRFTLPPNVTPNGVVLYLRVQFSDGSEQLILRVKTTTPCERIYHAVAQQKGAEPHSFRLHHDGEILPRNESTAADLNLENDAVLDYTIHFPPVDDRDVKPDTAAKINLTIQYNDGSEPLLMKVKTTTTFRKIYKAITQERRIYPDSFYLLYNGQRLLPNETTPSDLNLVNGQVLEFFHTALAGAQPGRATKVSLRIQFPHGIESMTLRVNPTTAFQKIYEAVARAQGVEPNSFLLYHNGERLLSNETTLTDLNLDNDDVLDFFSQDAQLDRADKISLSVQFCNGSESLMLRVKQTVAFQKIYDAVAQHMGLDPTSFSLHYHGQRLLPNKTPTDLNIHNNAVLNHFLTFPRPYDRDVVSDRDAKITLHIECHGNRQGPITLRLKTTTTFRKIYDVVARVIDWELNTLFLVYDGRRLPSNETTPADWNIGNDAVLHLLLELRGGNASSFW